MNYSRKQEMIKNLISVQSGGWYDYNDHATSMKRLRSLGFEAIDYNIDNMINPNDYLKGKSEAPLTKLTREELIEYYRPMKEAAEENGIAFSQMHAPFPLYYHDNEEYNDFLLGVVENIIAVCGFVGCPALVVHPYVSSTGDKEKEFSVNFDMYRRLIPTALMYNVKICLENIPRWLAGGHIINGCCTDPDEACYYIDTLNELAGAEVFGFCFDVGHANVTARDIRADIKVLGKRITILHIHDNNATADQHLIPYTVVSNGRPALDWEAFISGLHDIGYEGTLSFETSGGVRQFPAPVVDDALKLICSIGRYFRSRLES